MTFTYPNTTTPIFENVAFDVTMGDRIALLGPNGIGKSTFLSVLNNTLEPQVVGAGRGGDCQGEIYRHHNLVIGYFAQHHIDALESTLSPLQHMMKIAPQSSEQELRGLLGSFGITGQLAIQVGLRGRSEKQPIGTLSGGQKSRVVFATLSYYRPHILLLDEPTNHLDMDTVEALVTTLKEFNGGLVIVSHDQYLVEEVCNKLYVIDEKRHIHLFEGTFENYKKYSLRNYKHYEEPIEIETHYSCFLNKERIVHT